MPRLKFPGQLWSRAERTVTAVADGMITPDATPPERKPDLYSTEGSIGMKVVADPPNPHLDIVFVHGLTGNRDTTWTHKNGVFWPERLAEDIETARIITFGYDADVVKLWGMAGGNNLRNHGKSLAFAVSDQRRDCRERPIIFIAHSLGGLVCEQSLLYCGEGDKNLEKVFQSTRGIIFMGTPHGGADLANWGYKLAKYLNVVRKTNSAILDPLRQKSDVLTAVQQQFQQSLRKPGVSIEIYCFFEEKAVVGVGVIVPEHSAALSQYPNQSIAANHMDMTKFSGRNDEGYQKVLSRLHDYMEWINALTTEISQKTLDESGHNPRRPEYRQPPSSAAEPRVVANQTVSTTGSGTAIGIGSQNVQGGFHIYRESRRINTDCEKEMKCHRLLRTSEYERYKERNPDPVEGTCKWFLQHPNYVNWRDSQISSLLWVSADPGYGKSVLSKFLADKELQTTKSRTICYFFFKDDNEDQKTATNALCAILHQLFKQNPELLEYAVKCHDQNGDKLTGNADLLWSLLVTASADPHAVEIICVLDALDECRQPELRILLQKLCSFYADCPRPLDKMALKFLVTSRPLRNIEDEFHHLSQRIPMIRLAGEEDTDCIRHEINLVIEHELTQIQHKWHLDNNAVRLLREEFVKVEHRTYLWLTLIFDLIRNDLESVTKRGRQKIFSTIPYSVDAAYTAILNKSTDKDQARKLLQVVCAATRPLSVKEMSIAILIQAEDKTLEDLEIQSDDYSKKWIRNLCGLFVSVIDGRVYLLHQTAKEFLIAQDNFIQSKSGPVFDGIWKNSLSIQDSNALLAYICIWFLRLKEFRRKSSSLESEEINQLLSRYDFLEYSAMNWAVHLRAAMIQEDHPLIALGLELCDVQADRYMSWEQIYWGKLENISPPAGLNNLQYASLLGLKKVVGQLLAVPGVNVNAADKNGRTPLRWSASRGHEAVVRLLLTTPDIHVNAADKDGRTPLWLAASAGHEVVVGQLLVAPGIDVNAADKDGRTPLWWAASAGHEAVVGQLLTAPGIDVNAADKDSRTLLWWAASAGYEAVVSRLLATPGIDVNTADKYGRTPLRWAVFGRHEAVVRQLLAAPGIDVNAADKDGWTPLWWAAFRRHEAVVRLLLNTGKVDVDSKDNNGQTPLSWAAERGHKVVVKLLLDTGKVDVNSKDEDGRTPLALAAANRHEDVVRLLESMK